jgi:alpha-L-fucosidase
MKRFLCLGCGLLIVAGVISAAAANMETPAQREARIAWWREGRLGLFIHYGPVSLTGKEISWSRANSNPKCPNKGPTPVAVYDNLYKEFNPTNFNANDWARVARVAGMKYVVLTAKHCDGFLLWDSKIDSYDIMSTPFRRDICAELAKAVRKNDLRLGWYFSPMDWRDADFRTERNGLFLQRMQGQLCELLSGYGKVDLLWFDHDGREAVYDQTNTYALVKTLQPKIVINNRLDLGVKQGNTLMLNPNADYYTPEQRIGSYDDQRPWETCMTLGTQWSWKPEDKIKTPAEVVGIIARTLGGDGNLLLNVGPMPDGRIEPRQVAVLETVGGWVKKNEASIYGTRGGPFKPSANVTSTRRGKQIYVTVLKWPEGALKLPAIQAKVLGAKTLSGGRVDCQQTGEGIEISLAPEHRDPLATVIALKLDGDGMSIPAVDVAAANPTKAK